MINASEIMRAQLTRSLGLDKYAEIMRGDPASPSFQRAVQWILPYIGSSTRSEIKYAKETGKPVCYLED